MNSDAKLIFERQAPLFKRRSKTTYELMVVNDRYARSYNVFFNAQRQGQRFKSTPLHRVTNYKLDELEVMIRDLQQLTALSITYVGFTGLRWPQSQRLIQGRKHNYE